MQRDPIFNGTTDVSQGDHPLVKGVDGGLVPTCIGFINMIALFEREIGRTKARCIDATEGGAIVQGTRVMKLREAIRESIEGLTTCDFSALLTNAWVSKRMHPVVSPKEGLSWLLNEAEQVESRSRDALNLLRGLPERADPEEATETGPEVLPFHSMIEPLKRHSDYINLLKDWMRDTSLQKYRLPFRMRRSRGGAERYLIEKQYWQEYVGRTELLSRSIRRFGIPVLEELETKEGIS